MGAEVRAYVDRPITDAAAATSAATEAARQWGLADPGVLRVGMNAIFVTGNEVLRVSAPTVPASVSLELASFLADAGLRVPTPARDEVVVVGELSVTSWVRLEPVDTPVDWAEVGEMVRVVHSIDRSTLPDRVPLPDTVDLPVVGLRRAARAHCVRCSTMPPASASPRRSNAIVDGRNWEGRWCVTATCTLAMS